MSDTGAARGGYRRSATGLVGALLACLALFAVMWALGSWQRRSPEVAVPTVDYSAQLDVARSTAPFAVLAPVPAPEGWRATSVNYVSDGPDVSWHLGFLTADKEYVGLEQSNALASAFLAGFPADQPGQPVQVDGVAWQTLSSADGDEHALYVEGRRVTTLVTGTASEGELEAFAGALSKG